MTDRYRGYDHATGEFIWTNEYGQRLGTRAPDLAPVATSAAAPAAAAPAVQAPPPPPMTRETARRIFDQRLTALLDKDQRITRAAAIHRLATADPELHNLAFLSQAPVSEFGTGDTDTLAHGWNAAVAAELARCGDPVLAKSSARRKHPGLHSAFVASTQTIRR